MLRTHCKSTLEWRYRKTCYTMEKLSSSTLEVLHRLHGKSKPNNKKLKPAKKGKTPNPNRNVRKTPPPPKKNKNRKQTNKQIKQTKNEQQSKQYQYKKEERVNTMYLLLYHLCWNGPAMFKDRS